jgi:hypothetical protein
MQKDKKPRTNAKLCVACWVVEIVLVSQAAWPRVPSATTHSALKPLLLLPNQERAHISLLLILSLDERPRLQQIRLQKLFKLHPTWDIHNDYQAPVFLIICQ